MGDSPEDITRILRDMKAGLNGAEDRLIARLQPQLHLIAEARMRRERPDHTLQPTALINELYLRLKGSEIEWENRAHFFGVAARIMRQVLVDYARQHRAAKRGGALERVDLHDVDVGVGTPWEKMMALDRALTRLFEWDPRLSRVVEMRFFGDLTEEEIAEVLGKACGR